MNRIKTKYTGVYYLIKINKNSGLKEKVFYIKYTTPDKKQHHEKAGSSLTGLTAAKAFRERLKRMQGISIKNTEKQATKQLENQPKPQHINQQQFKRWNLNKIWETYKKVKNIKSLKRDDNRYKADLAKKFGKKTPGEIQALELDRFKTKLLKTHKPATVRNVLELLSRICNFGVSRKLCDPLGFTIEYPSVNNEKTEDLSFEQLKRLLDVLEEESDIQIVNIIKLALFTGMRRGEILKLKWTDIDFDKNIILIRDPKGGRDQKIPLNTAAKNILSTHPKINEWVFASQRSPNGQRQSTSFARVICEKAGLPKDFRPLQGQRHVFASIIASSGKVDMYTLQKLLTHKDPKMTQRYAHLRDEALKQASEVMVDTIEQVLPIMPDKPKQEEEEKF